MTPPATVSGPADTERLDLLCINTMRTRVVSMPSWGTFDRQPGACWDAVLLPASEARVAVETAFRLGKERSVGRQGPVLGLSDFGASPPVREFLMEFGFTLNHVLATSRTVLEARR